ncbi:MAG TPA: hypothetical protein VII75_09320 [Thermoanaerobaculia bacterium]|nr:hypothetical protein [Thermoanaerobaculia bacterium]
MSSDVLTCNVRNESLIPITLDVQDQADLSTLLGATVSLGPKKHAQLKRHVEAGKTAGRVNLGPANVVNAETAACDYLRDFFDTNFACVVNLKSAPRDITAVVNREDDGLEKVSI